MNKKFFVLFTLICLLILIINVRTSYQFIKAFFSILNERRSELTALYQYTNYLSQLKNAERSQKEFIITDNPIDLDSYMESLTYLNSTQFQDFIAEERQSPDDYVIANIFQIQDLAQKKLKELNHTIKIRKEQGFEAAQRLVSDQESKQLTDHLYYLINFVIQKQLEHLDLLDQKVQKTMRDTVKRFIISNSIAAILLGLSLLSLYTSIRKKEKKDEELSLALQKLNDSLATKEAILNSANYAIIATDQKGIITSFNPAAERMLGYQMDELIGKTNPSIFHEPKEIEARAVALSKQLSKKITPGFDVFTTLAKQGIPDTNEWTYNRKDGSHFPGLLCVTAIKNTQNDIIGYVGIVYDLTENKEIDRMRNELIAITSYELRSPIASIKGTLDLLSQQEFGLSEQAMKVLDVGKKNCQHLVRLTEEILDLQKLDGLK